MNNQLGLLGFLSCTRGCQGCFIHAARYLTSISARMSVANAFIAKDLVVICISGSRLPPPTMQHDYLASTLRARRMTEAGSLIVRVLDAVVRRRPLQLAVTGLLGRLGGRWMVAVCIVDGDGMAHGLIGKRSFSRAQMALKAFEQMH